MNSLEILKKCNKQIDMLSKLKYDMLKSNDELLFSILQSFATKYKKQIRCVYDFKKMDVDVINKNIEPFKQILMSNKKQIKQTLDTDVKIKTQENIINILRKLCDTADYKLIIRNNMITIKKK